MLVCWPFCICRSETTLAPFVTPQSETSMLELPPSQCAQFAAAARRENEPPFIEGHSQPQHRSGLIGLRAEAAPSPTSRGEQRGKMWAKWPRG
jgi:hypothetical protein